MGYNLVEIVQKDLIMSVGEIVAQCSHANILAYSIEKRQDDVT